MQMWLFICIYVVGMRVYVCGKLFFIPHGKIKIYWIFICLNRQTIVRLINFYDKDNNTNKYKHAHSHTFAIIFAYKIQQILEHFPKCILMSRTIAWISANSKNGCKLRALRIFTLQEIQFNGSKNCSNASSCHPCSIAWICIQVLYCCFFSLPC